MAISKLTTVMLVVCLFVLTCGALEPNKHQVPDQPGKPRGGHFVKRDADYGDFGDADGGYQERSFERPHRIRVLPGFLH